MIEAEVLKWRVRRGSREALPRMYAKYVHMLLTLALGLANQVVLKGGRTTTRNIVLGQTNTNQE
ncbi:MAG: hypothetical protein JW993_13815 [Sedimentisphaerales bacterium]|nr:hypothetical protein [Sedimentisphaerales bacterium]